MNYPATPELDKMLKVKDESQAIGRFLDWLVEERHIFLAEFHKHDDGCCIVENINCPLCSGYKFRGRICSRCDGTGSISNEHRACGCVDSTMLRISQSFDKLLHEYYDIDDNAEEAERLAVLDYIRNQNSVKNA